MNDASKWLVGMKQVVLACVVIVCAFVTAHAQTDKFLGFKSTASGSPDLLNETFDSTGYDNTWTECSSGCAGTLDEDDTSTPPSGSAGFSGQWLLADQGGFEKHYAYHDLSSAQSGTVYIRFQVYLDTESLTDGSAWAVVFDSGATTDAFKAGGYVRFWIQQVATDQLQIDGQVGSTTFTGANISIDTSYCVEASVNNTTNAYEWRINTTTQDSGTAAGLATDVQRIWVGNGDSAATRLMIDRVAVSSTGWVGCS